MPKYVDDVVEGNLIKEYYQEENKDYDEFKVAVTLAPHFASKTALRGFGVIMLESPSNEKLGA